MFNLDAAAIDLAVKANRIVMVVAGEESVIVASLGPDLPPILLEWGDIKRVADRDGAVVCLVTLGDEITAPLLRQMMPR